MKTLMRRFLLVRELHVGSHERKREGGGGGKGGKEGKEGRRKVRGGGKDGSEGGEEEWKGRRGGGKEGKEGEEERKGRSKRRRYRCRKGAREGEIHVLITCCVLIPRQVPTG